MIAELLLSAIAQIVGGVLVPLLGPIVRLVWLPIRALAMSIALVLRFGLRQRACSAPARRHGMSLCSPQR